MLKPISTYLLGGLSAVLITEVVLLQINPFAKSKQAQGPLAKYDVKFMRVMESLKKTAVAAGFKYKNSSTTREMVSYLSGKFPDQKKILNPILMSIEAHIYGESSITNDDYNNYSRWLSIAPTLQVVRARVKV